MKQRVCVWAAVGFLVASFWAFVLFPTASANSTLMVTLARVTCPVAFVGFGLRVYWVLLANAVTYVLIGLLVEMARAHKPSTQF